MKRMCIALFLLVLWAGLCAQWSTSSATPNLICSLTDTQVMPKTAITSGGITWIAWMDNLTGTYYTYLQKLNSLGVPEFTNPLLVSDNLTDTWLTEWDLDCDPEGNAILCFQDIRLGTNNVVIYKISPSGVFLWGEDGIMLSNDTTVDTTNMAPVILCMSDGRTIAGWQRSGTTTETRLQCISSLGNLLWGPAGISITAPNLRYTWPQFLESDNNCVLVKYFEDSGPVWAPTRKILVQKYSATGVPQWLTPTVVQNLGGIAAWTQLLSIDTDGMSGMLICWHDDRNAENISHGYIQRIMADGAVTMPVDGVRVSMENDFHQFYPKLAYEPVQEQVYVFWNRVNGNQDMWGLSMQKLSLDGIRMWDANGQVLSILDVYPTYPIRACRMETGVVFVYSISPASSNDQLAYLESQGVSSDGTSIWGAAFGHIATTSTNKLHYDFDIRSDLWFVLAWEDGSGPSNTHAMRLNYNGALGGLDPMPYNLSAQVVDDNNVLLQWDFPLLDVPPLAFKVYRNGFFLHQVNGGDTVQDTVFALGPGLWSFHITAMYENGSESVASNEATINITGWEDDTMPTAPFNLLAYPNPFRESISLRLKNLDSAQPVEISVYNLKGQLITRYSFTGKQELNWLWDGKASSGSFAASGIYLLRIANGTASRTAKLMKF